MIGPTDYFPYQNGRLACEGVDLDFLAKKYGTPLYVYSKEAFLKPYRALDEALDGIPHGIHYAVKANSNLNILRLLGGAGAGMDVVSGGELARALVAGVPGPRIVFSGVGKSAEEMRQALRVKDGIYSFNVESLPELELLAQVAQAEGAIARVAWRFNPDVDAKTHPSISTGLKKNKFGMPAADCLKATERARELRSIQLVGLSCHIGSQIFDLKAFEQAYTRTIQMGLKVAKVLGSPLEFLDFGGGLGVRYKNEKPIALPKYGAMIRKVLEKEWKGLKGAPRVSLEPGRLFSGNSGVLLSRVIYRKKQGSRDFLILDAAMNDLMRPALYEAYHEIIPAREVKGKTVPMDIVGPVCESTDCFATGRKMPDAIQAGDLVAILSAGAYGASLANSYNTRGRSAEILVDRSAERVIRRRETLEDQWAAEASG
jgi:diaminopimelate decarboxylase